MVNIIINYTNNANFGSRSLSNIVVYESWHAFTSSGTQLVGESESLVPLSVSFNYIIEKRNTNHISFPCQIIVLII